MLFAPGELTVEEIPGEPYRYYVSSSNRAEPPYLVDVEARWPLTRCTCRNYECVRWPAFKKTLYPIRCKHGTAALVYHGLRHIRLTAKHLKGDGE